MSVTDRENVPQLFNLALATSLIVTAADAVQDLVQAERVESFWLRIGYLAFIVFWASKLFVDDHRILGRGKATPTIDFIFLIISYSLLISGAAVIRDGDTTYWLLALHYAVLSLWVVAGLTVGKVRRGSGAGVEEEQWKWLLTDLLALAGLVMLGCARDNPTSEPMALFALIIFALADIVWSGTFSEAKLRLSGEGPSTTGGAVQ